MTIHFRIPWWVISIMGSFVFGVSTSIAGISLIGGMGIIISVGWIISVVGIAGQYYNYGVTKGKEGK